MNKILLILFCVAALSCDGQVTFQKTYGGQFHDDGAAIQQTTDGGYIVTGRIGSFTGSYDKVGFLKIDANGDTMWTKCFGGTSIITGITGNSNDYHSYNFYIIKTDSMGNSGCNEGSPVTIVTVPATIAGNSSPQLSSGAIVSSPATITSSGRNLGTYCYAIGIDELHSRAGIKIFPNPATT